MKKFLSLVLALVMTMSLVTISAGAKDFTDNSKITYKEAVDVVSALKIVDGYEDGAFNPANTLTRGAAAKIICNLILGPTTASALSADTAPYKDVPTNNTFAGYIAYCAQQGIISGYADGTFRPAATLTGYAFMKMLLGALGYDADIEGFVGANWSVQVGKQAIGIGLDDGNDEFVGTKAVTREEACLYAFNTLQATMVEYENQSSIVIGDITVNTSSKAKDMANTSTKTDGNISKDGKMQFAEKYFTDLRLRDGRDDFARPANVWTLKSNEVGTYAKTADATYTVKTEIGDIYKDLGLAATVDKSDVSVYVDGVKNDDQKPMDIKKGDDDNKYGNRGVLTEVFYDEDDGTITITEVNTYVGELNKTVKATSKKDAYVVLTRYDVAPTGTSGTLEFETEEEFDDDAILLYTYSIAAEEVKSVAAAEEVTGTATKTINKTNDMDQNNGLTIDGTDYKMSAKNTGELLGNVSVDSDYTVYLDTYGNVIYIEEADTAIGNYALLLNTAPSNIFVGKKAELVFVDGTREVVTTAKNYNDGANEIANGTIVTYKESDGVYTLKAVSAKQSDKSYNETVKSVDSVDFKMTNDKASVTVDNSLTGDNVYKSVTTNSKTVFVVQNPTDPDDWTAYTGIKNAPTIEAANAANKKVDTFYFCKSGKMATVMFVIPGSALTVDDNSNTMLFLAAESMGDLTHTSNSDYFEYDAVVNGKIETVKVDEDVKVDGEAGDGSALNGLYKSFTTDKYGVITSVTSYEPYSVSGGEDKSALTGTGIDKRSADYTVILDTADANETITVADNAVFYAVDKKGNITETSYRAIAKDSNDLVYAVVKDYLVQTLFVETVEGDETHKGPSFDARDYQVNYDTRDISVLYAKGADNDYDTLLDVILADLEDKGYTDFAVDGGAISAKKGNRTVEFTWDEDTTNESVAIEIDGKSYLAEDGAMLDAVVDTSNNVVAAGKYAIETNKDGEKQEAADISGIAIAAGSSYDTGYAMLIVTEAMTNNSTDNSGATLTAALADSQKEFVKAGKAASVKVTVTTDTKIETSAVDIQDADGNVVGTMKVNTEADASITVTVELAGDDVANDVTITLTAEDPA